MVKGIIALMFILFCLSGMAQVEHYDTLTYNDYINASWKELIVHGKEAEAANALSAYGEKRMGYAHYMLGNYFASINYYNTILGKDSSDVDALTMLNLNYYNLGNTTQMKRIQGLMSADLKKYLLLPETRIIESAYVEGGTSFTDNYNNDKAHLYGPTHFYGSQKLMGNINNGLLGLNVNLSSVFSIYAAYKSAVINNEQRVAATVEPKSNAGGILPKIGPDTSVSAAFQTKQSQFYINGTIAFKNGSVTPFFHYISGSGDAIVTTYQDLRYQKTLPNSNPPDTFIRSFSFLKLSGTVTNFIAGVSLKKQVSHVALEGNISISNFASMKQLQAGASLAYYPFGDTRFSITPQVKYLTDSLNGDLISQLNITAKLHRYCWLTLYGSHGDLEHSNEQNGTVFFNNSDITNNRLGATLFCPISKVFHVYFDYQYQDSQSWFYTCNGLADTGHLVFTNYKNNYITLGLKINL